MIALAHPRVEGEVLFRTKGRLMNATSIAFLSV
jgi:hypothetical protein